MVLENFLIDADILWDRVGKKLKENPEARAGRKMRVKVINGGIVEDLTGYTLNLGWQSSIDETKFGLDAFEAVDISEGIFEIAYTSGMLSNYGRLVGTLQLVPTTGQPIESNNFNILVKKSAINPEAIQGETSFSTLENALVEVNDWNARIDVVEQDFKDRADALDGAYPVRLTAAEQSVAAVEAQVDLLNRGLGETMPTMASLLSTYPTGDTRDHIVAGNIAEVDTLTVTAIPTAAGNITITLNGVAKTVAVDSAVQSTTALVATAIRAAVYTGWTTGGTGSVVTFTATTVGTRTAPVFSAGTTGTTGTFARTAIGEAANFHRYFWNDTAWTDGGAYQAIEPASRSIVGSHLSRGFTSRPNIDGASGGDLNTAIDTGTYLFLNSPLNRPSGFSGASGFIVSNTSNERWVIQNLYDYSDAAIQYIRRIDLNPVGAPTFGAWKKLLTDAVPDGSITNAKLANGSVTAAKLSSNYDYKSQLNSSTDLSTILTAGSYLCIGDMVNAPADYSTMGSGRLIVNVVGSDSRWVLQTISQLNDPTVSWVRALDIQNLGSEKAWTRNTIGLYNLVTRPMLDSNYGWNGVPTDFGIVDLNELTTEGSWVSQEYIANQPAEATSTSAFITVTPMGSFYIQEYTEYAPTLDYTNIWRRVIRPSTSVYSNWVKLKVGESLVTYPYPALVGEQIVNFGDSIFGNFDGADSISSFITSIADCTSINVGFGGCRMAQHTTFWDAFSMYRLVDAIITRDFSIQDAAIIAGAGVIPSYFASRLERLKAIDFSTIGYITVAYGTNDYTAGLLLENLSNLEDTTKFNGALRYSLRRLYEAFPHLKILVCTPTYRFWSNPDTTFKEDSDTKFYNSASNTLPNFVENAISVSRETKTPVLDNYFELGVNKYNRLQFFTTADGTHPIATGREKMARKICSALITHF